MIKFYYHGESSDGHRFTVGWNVDGMTAVAAIAICSFKDHFVRKQGIAKVNDRYNDKESPSDKGTLPYNIVVFSDVRHEFLRFAKSLEYMHSSGLKKFFNLDNNKS